ncbi:MAG: type VI secretion system tube protein Hcp [Vicinamibacterales bacterium]
MASPSLRGGELGRSDLVTTVYLDITGVAGDVTDPGFEGQIEVVSYSVSATSGPGEMSLIKYIDSSSPALLLLATTGNYVGAATLSVVQTVNGAVASSMKIDMRNVLITSVVTGSETEAVALSFQRSKVKTKNGGIVDTDPVIGLYLDIKDIPGDVTDPGFEGQIEVVSYSLSATTGPGEMSLIKYIDSSSPRLFAIATSGSQLKAARLTVVQTVNGAIYSSMTIDLRDVIITSMVTGSETESITLSFQRSKGTQ